MNPQHPHVILVGAGVVGRAILKAHLDAGVSVRIADQDASSLQHAVASLTLDPAQWSVIDSEPIGRVAAVDRDPQR